MTMMARRAENFATLAANATQRVVRIIHGNTVFGLRAPIDLDVREEGPYCVVEYEPLGLQGRGRDQEEALESFADQFRIDAAVKSSSAFSRHVSNIVTS